MSFPFISTASRLLLPALVFAAGAVWAQPAPVKVEGAWVRATVPGQQGTGAFMNLTAREGLRLVGVSSPVAGVAEVHEMKMDGDIMKMRAVPALDLPAGQTVQLKPGSYHLMLMSLKRPLAKDSSVPLTLRFKDSKGVESALELSIPVGLSAPAPSGPAAVAPSPSHSQHGDHKH